MGRVERLAREGLRLQRSDGTAHPYDITLNWKQGPELHRLFPRYERGEMTVSLPCVRNGGAPTCRSPRLSPLIRFERRPKAASVDAP